MNNKHASFLSITRRRFLTLSAKGIGLAVVSQGLMGCLDSDSDDKPIPVQFSHGLASGDPTQTSVILWTRAVPTDSNFRINKQSCNTKVIGWHSWR